VADDLTPEMAPHCTTCVCGRRAPVQGHYTRGRKPPGTIAWWEHEKAWEGYGHSQSAEQIAKRGGFGYDELVSFLGHEPTTWSVR